MNASGGIVRALPSTPLPGTGTAVVIAFAVALVVVVGNYFTHRG